MAEKAVWETVTTRIFLEMILNVVAKNAIIFYAVVKMIHQKNAKNVMMTNVL